MGSCPDCSATLPEGGRFCSSCGCALDSYPSPPTETSAPSELPTAASAPERSRDAVTSRRSHDRSRFVPGSVLDRRYRIVGLLGRGGMGEVYRADDLKLGQPVALKFLPAGLERDRRRLSRFLDEVRTARQVTHSNVCRVYDIAEVNGQHYLSMEYVDGEDLSSLLRRIGRLPRDKALQISRQICAGLQAAHDVGILHRDLKPANVMIDGRGRAKITDFGLASLERMIQAGEIRSGTPAYMAPEQFAGREVTVRSDVYALGLVLYELFTGKQAFEASSLTGFARQHSDATPSKPSSHVSGFDPGVEQIILSCLEKDPGARPASALAVSAALPGGDPLAAALAAGETPSPEMVADAGEGQGLRPPVALACLIAILAGVVGGAWYFGRYHFLARAGPERSPEVLAADARGLLERLGYPEPGLDRAHGFNVDWSARGETADERFLIPDPPPLLPLLVQFWYRESPRHLVSTRTTFFGSPITRDDPPLDVSGMRNVRLDTRGRLLELVVVPPEVDDSEGPWPEPQWPVVLEGAGYAADAVTAVRPVWNAPVTSDVRAAWEAAHPYDASVAVRLEAAAYRGKPVFFRTVYPWTRAERMEAHRYSTGQRIADGVFVSVLVSLVIGCALLARRNLRRGSGDRRGAARVALFVFLAAAGIRLLMDHPLAPELSVLGLVLTNVGRSLLDGALAGTVYLALEPFVRRLWPEVLISWNRLLEGRLKDPRLGRDILVGGALGLVTDLPRAAQLALLPDAVFQGTNPIFHSGWRHMTAKVLLDVAYACWPPLFLLALFLFLRFFLRRQWIVLTVMFVFGTLAGGSAAVGVLGWIGAALGTAAFLFVLVRFGLLAAVAYWYFGFLHYFPFVLKPGAWYFDSSMFFLALPLALAVYGFAVSRAGRPVLGDRFLLGEAS